MSQTREILEHLRSGAALTPLEALERFGCIALHSRAAELRAQGHDVRCKIHTHDGKKWGVYTYHAPSQG